MIRRTFYIILSTFVFISSAIAAYRAPAWSKNGMAATPHPAATEAAVKALEAGGNAVDAAVAAAFALAVVEPYHSGLGGGEFALVRMTKQRQVEVIDARESAPKAATQDMYLDPATGEPISRKSWRGGLAVGVPGSVAGRIEMIERFGKLSLEEVIQPAKELASRGFEVDRILAARVKRYGDALAEDAATAEIFTPGGVPIPRGEILVQPRLAQCLGHIGSDGGNSFFNGAMAELIVKACRAAGGIMTRADLAEYEVIWRKPVRFTYRDYEVFSMPPPSSGGCCLAEILNILEGYPLDFLDAGSAEAYHLLASAFEHAFADRARWLEDPAFSPQPVAGMSSREYAEKIRENIDRHQRNPVEKAGDPWMFNFEGNTSHISVIDSERNMCVITTSVNTTFGSMVFVSELGFFLNSTMDDFVTAPKNPNKYELVGGKVNLIEPGKRPLSSMSPTLVLKDDTPFLAVGSVGGPRIITSVAQIIINVVDFGMNIQAAMDAPRIHMQWQPDKLYVEDEITPEVIDALRNKGWKVFTNGNWSLSQAVSIDTLTGEFFGASDARGVGSAGSPALR